MDVYRKNPVPAVYTQLPFVREWDNCMLADCPDDAALLTQIQSVAAGHVCVSELESTAQLIVKATFPDDILQRTGNSGDVITWACYCWKLWDAESLVTANVPAEAVHPTNAGIDDMLLESLAHPTSCIPLLRTTADGFPKGYSLDPKTKARLEELEAPIIARVKLHAMKQLSPPATRKRPASKTDPSISSTLRTQILRRDNYRCVFCGQDSSTVVIEVDHIIPRSLINKLHLNSSLHTATENLCTMCFDCNRGKRDHLAKEDITFYTQAFCNVTHPNHGIVRHLATIGSLQAL